MTLTNEIIVEMSKAAFPDIGNDIEAVDLYTQQIHKQAMKAQGEIFHQLSELYFLMVEVRKVMFEQRAKLYQVAVN